MIVKEEVLNRVRELFRLNLYEAKIWLALLSRGVSTAGELSEIGDVPRSRAYDILESLEKKKFIVMKIGKPIQYLAVPPSEVIERAKKNFIADAKEASKRLDELGGTDVLKEIETLHKQGIEFVEPSDLSGAIRGRNNLYTHMETIIKNAKKSVYFLTTSNGLVRKVEALKPILESLAKKGVKIRVAANYSKDIMPVVEDLSKIADVRFTDKVNARFCIVDGKEVLFMTMDDKNVHPTYDIGIWINTPYFANALSSLFDIAWNDMQKNFK